MLMLASRGVEYEYFVDFVLATMSHRAKAHYTKTNQLMHAIRCQMIWSLLSFGNITSVLECVWFRDIGNWLSKKYTIYVFNDDIIP